MVKNVLSADALRSMITDVFIRNGLTIEQANIISENLVLTELCGVKSHGIAMVPAHIKRWNNNGYTRTPDIRVEKTTACFSVVNSDNAIGMISGKFCMELAMEKAKQGGLHVVFAKHCNTYGAAFTYGKMAADQKMIGITFCNTPTAMAPWGGKTKLIGTNPISICVPAKSGGSVLFDMATSIVAKSKFNDARRKGEQIPLGWGLDPNGEPTTDPLEAIKGFVLPMAQHKGYGLALCLDLLSGVLSGSGYSDQVNRFYSEDNACMEVGQTFIAIAPSQICDDDFYQRVDDYIAKIHDSGAIYPGENFHENYADAEQNGIEVSDEWLEQMQSI